MRVAGEPKAVLRKGGRKNRVTPGRAFVAAHGDKHDACLRAVALACRPRTPTPYFASSPRLDWVKAELVGKRESKNNRHGANPAANTRRLVLFLR